MVPKIPEPETLFDDYANRASPARTQDMTIAKTMTPRDLKLTTPATLNAQQKEAWEAYYGPRNEKFKQANLEGKDLVRWKYQRYMHDYLACIAAVDDAVGLVERRGDLEADDDPIGTDLVVAESEQFIEVRRDLVGEHGATLSTVWSGERSPTRGGTAHHAAPCPELYRARPRPYALRP